MLIFRQQRVLCSRPILPYYSAHPDSSWSCVGFCCQKYLNGAVKGKRFRFHSGLPYAHASCQDSGLSIQEPGAKRHNPAVLTFVPCNNGSGNRISSIFFFSSFFDVVVHQQQLPNSENFVHFGTIEALVSLGPLFIFHSLIISITQQAVEIVATLMFKKSYWEIDQFCVQFLLTQANCVGESRVIKGSHKAQVHLERWSRLIGKFRHFRRIVQKTTIKTFDFRLILFLICQRNLWPQGAICHVKRCMFYVPSINVLSLRRSDWLDWLKLPATCHMSQDTRTPVSLCPLTGSSEKPSASQYNWITQIYICMYSMYTHSRFGWQSVCTSATFNVQIKNESIQGQCQTNLTLWQARK